MQSSTMVVSATLALLGAVVLAEADLGVKVDGPTASVTRGGKLVLEYRADQTPFKPYVRALFSPGGTNVLRDAPADHLHHHGLMFAVSADGVNYWEETATAGKQQHESLEPTAHGLLQRVRWQAPAEQGSVLWETRRIEVATKPVGGATLIAWQTQLATGEGRESVKLTGNEYFGLGMRFIAAMDSSSEFVTGDDWCACLSDNGDSPVTVAVFDHPGNPRRARWFTMTAPFAYLSATLNLHREPLQIDKDKPLRLRYGVAVWDGKRGEAEIEKACRAWREQDQPEKP